MRLVTIRGGVRKGADGSDQEYLGYTSFEKVPNKSTEPTPSSLKIQLAGLVAGQVAEELAGYEHSSGWNDDLREVRLKAARYLLEWSNEKEFLGIKVDDSGKAISLAGHKLMRFEQRMTELIDEAKATAQTELSQNWDLVRSMTAELVLRGQMTGKRAEEIRGRVEANRTEAMRKGEVWSRSLADFNQRDRRNPVRSCEGAFSSQF